MSSISPLPKTRYIPFLTWLLALVRSLTHGWQTPIGYLVILLRIVWTLFSMVIFGLKWIMGAFFIWSSLYSLCFSPFPISLGMDISLFLLGCFLILPDVPLWYTEEPLVTENRRDSRGYIVIHWCLRIISFLIFLFYIYLFWDLMIYPYVMWHFFGMEVPPFMR